MRKMLEILPQVRCWKERVDQMTLLVGGARSTVSCGYWSEPLHQGRGGVYLPGENLAAFKWVKMKTTPLKCCQAREGNLY